MEFDEADNVVLFCGRDQCLVMIKGLHGRLGYQDVDTSLDGVGRDGIVGT